MYIRISRVSRSAHRCVTFEIPLVISKTVTLTISNIQQIVVELSPRYVVVIVVLC